MVRGRGARLIDPVRGQIGKKIKNIGGLDTPDEVQVNVPDVDVLQRRIDRHIAAHELHEPKEHPQVQVVFGNGQGRLALDALVIGQEVPQNLRAIGITLHGTFPPFQHKI